MVKYVCGHCNFLTFLKSNYTRHLKTKKHIIANDKSLITMVKTQKDPKKTQKDPKKTQKDPVFSCEFCDSIFSSYAHKRRHELHRCKENSSIKIISDKNKKIKKLENQVDKLIAKTGNLTFIQHTQNTQNQHNNIQINNYGNEDLTHLTDYFKTQLLNGPFGAIPKMIEAIHFNNDKPENKNIKYPNTNKNYIKIRQNNEWVFKNKQNILRDMIDSKYLILDDHYNLILNGENISNNIKKKYTNFREKYDEGNSNLLNDLINDCEIMILNNRD